MRKITCNSNQEENDHAVTYIIQQFVTIRVHLGQFSEGFISHKTDFMAILEGSSSVITNGKENFNPV